MTELREARSGTLEKKWFGKDRPIGFTSGRGGSFPKAGTGLVDGLPVGDGQRFLSVRQTEPSLERFLLGLNNAPAGLLPLAARGQTEDLKQLGKQRCERLMRLHTTATRQPVGPHFVAEVQTDQYRATPDGRWLLTRTPPSGHDLPLMNAPRPTAFSRVVNAAAFDPNWIHRDPAGPFAVWDVERGQRLSQPVESPAGHARIIFIHLPTALTMLTFVQLAEKAGEPPVAAWAEVVALPSLAPLSTRESACRAQATRIMTHRPARCSWSIEARPARRRAPTRSRPESPDGCTTSVCRRRRDYPDWWGSAPPTSLPGPRRLSPFRTSGR